MNIKTYKLSLFLEIGQADRNVTADEKTILFCILDISNFYRHENATFIWRDKFVAFFVF